MDRNPLDDGADMILYDGGRAPNPRRVRIFLADRGDFDAVAPVVGRYFAAIRPANTTVISQLVDPRMKIEIEVTARRADTSAP